MTTINHSLLAASVAYLTDGAPPASKMCIAGALVILPLICWYSGNVTFWWLCSCVLLANLLDFLVAAKLYPFPLINNWIHFWEGRTTVTSMITCEIVQTILLIALTVGIIVTQRSYLLCP